MNKLKSKIKQLSRAEKIIASVLILLTIFRIFLALKLPLHIQADAVYDDQLFIKYAKDLLAFNWLGSFDQLSLAKGCSFAIFLALNYFIGIPYSFSLITIYILSLIVLCLALSKIIKSKAFLTILYIFLLYFPIMFHDENVQKVYRGGLLAAAAILVVAAFIGLYAQAQAKFRKLLPWSILATISLSFFWFLKEDSIWILPAILVFTAATIYQIFRQNRRVECKIKIQKVLLVAFPFVFLAIAMFGYRTINYMAYGEFSITDRGGTAFKFVAGDLLRIDSEDRSVKNWITKSMLKKAYSASPTFAKLEPEITKKYEFWAGEDGEINGDIIFWVIKDAAYDLGIYNDPEKGKAVNNFYQQIHNELNDAFENETLSKNNDFYISSVAKGITIQELPDFLSLLNRAKDIGITFAYNEAGVYPATGDRTGIALFNEFTMSQYVDPDADQAIYKPARVTAATANFIAKPYQKIGKILFYATIIVAVIFTIFVIVRLFQKKLNKTFSAIFLVVFGLSASCFAQFFGTTFFCRFLSDKKIYDYISPMLPLFAVVEIIACYLAFVTIKQIARRNKKS